MAKIRNRYNQAPHLTQDTNGKVTASQLDVTNESLEVSQYFCDFSGGVSLDPRMGQYVHLGIGRFQVIEFHLYWH